MAFALEETRKELVANGSNLTLEDFDYFNETPEIGEAIERHLKNTSFAGVSVSACCIVRAYTEYYHYQGTVFEGIWQCAVYFIVYEV